MRDWLKKLFDSPSRRSGIDYSREISFQAIFAVLLLYRDYLHMDGNPGYGEVWIGEVIRDLGHLYHSFAAAYGRSDLDAIREFLNAEPSPEAFLDFLEVSLKNSRAPHDNDFVDAINDVLDQHPRLFMEHVDKGFRPGVFVRSEPGFS